MISDNAFMIVKYFLLFILLVIPRFFFWRWLLAPRNFTKKGIRKN